MVDQPRLKLLAERLVAQDGRPVTFQKLNTTSQDSAQPWKGAADIDSGGDYTELVDQPAVFVEPSAAIRLGLNVEVNDWVKRSEKIMITSPPETEDMRTYGRVLDDAMTWKITGMSGLEPGLIKMLWFIGVKR